MYYTSLQLKSDFFFNYLERKFFEMECGGILVRIRHLLDATKFNSLLNFCRKILQIKRLSTDEQLMRLAHTTQQHQYVQEVYMTLLVKMKMFDRLEHELATMEPQALDMYLRCSIQAERAHKGAEAGVQTPEANYWLHFKCQGNEYAVQYTVMCLLRQKKVNDNSIQSKLDYYLGMWIEYNRIKPDFLERVKTLLKCAFSRQQLYMACEQFHLMVWFYFI